MNIYLCLKRKDSKMIKLLKRIFNIFKYDDMSSKYIWISILGIIARYVTLGFLCKSLIVSLGITLGILISIGAFILNWFIEFPLYKFTYIETGIFYKSGSNSVIGSLLYLIVYFINCGLIFIIQWFYNNWIYYRCIAIYIVLVLIIRGIVELIRNK